MLCIVNKVIPAKAGAFRYTGLFLDLLVTAQYPKAGRRRMRFAYPAYEKPLLPWFRSSW